MLIAADYEAIEHEKHSIKDLTLKYLKNEPQKNYILPLVGGGIGLIATAGVIALPISVCLNDEVRSNRYLFFKRISTYLFWTFRYFSLGC